jgi:predicted aspartyl protease
LQGLDIAPEFASEFETADGRVVKREMAEARIHIDGSVRTTPIVFADAADSILLGVVTLEQFSLGVDPVNRRLIPVRGLAMGRRALP